MKDYSQHFCSSFTEAVVHIGYCTDQGQPTFLINFDISCPRPGLTAFSLKNQGPVAAGYLFGFSLTNLPSVVQQNRPAAELGKGRKIVGYKENRFALALKPPDPVYTTVLKNKVAHRKRFIYNKYVRIRMDSN